MRVLVTGGTGFVGSHSVRALLEAGHDVRMLVRSPERIRPALHPLGVGEQVESVVGEMDDPSAVRRALEGCEAVLHSASVYKLSRRHSKEMESRNPRGTEVVLETAHELGLDPIVHVSSYVALLPPSDGRVTADAPVGHPAGPYARSKAASEAIARRLQEEGAPVVITQPGAVWGPYDPHFGESSQIASMILKGRMPVALPGLMAIVDVRDVAAAHRAVMEPGQGPRRFLLVAEDLSFSEMIDVVRRTTGRRLPAAPLPKGLLRGTLGRLRRVPAEIEGPWIALQAARHDSSASRDALGLELRPAAEAIGDTVRWLEASGRVR